MCCTVGLPSAAFFEIPTIRHNIMVDARDYESGVTLVELV